MAGVIYDQVGSLELGQMDRGERVEKKVDIYESVDALRVQETEDTNTVHTLPERRRGRRCSRLTVAAVCLGLLCVLLMITIILIYMHFVNVNLRAERASFKSYITNLTEERHQLNISIHDLANERDQLNISIQNLTKERHQLNISIHDLANERDQLNISLQNLTEENLTLQRKYDDLVQQIEKIIHFHEWKEFGSSFYFFSTEQKTWSESRQHCRDRRADLVIINSREEQVFLIEKKKNTRFWIGLHKSKGQNQWMWVDNQLLNEDDEFYKQYESNVAGIKEEDCAVYNTTAEGNQLLWKDLVCSQKMNWVCEFNLTAVYSLNHHSQSSNNNVFPHS